MRASVAILAVLVILSLSGCVDVSEQGTQPLVNYLTNPEVQKAEKYTSKIVFNDVDIRRTAAQITQNCSSGDKECEVNKIFRYVVDNYKYYSDPRSREFVQDPFQTMDIGGGDCEDLSILASSLFENLGIKTYFVLAENHAFVLACGVDTTKLWSYSERALLEKLAAEKSNLITKDGKLYLYDIYSKKEIINPNNVLFRGGYVFSEGSNVTLLDIRATISSSEPVDIYVVPSSKEYDLFLKNSKFKQYTDCLAKDQLEYEKSCNGISSNSGLVIENPGPRSSVVDINIEFYFHYPLENLGERKVVSYILGNDTCVAIDPSTGSYSYPGYMNATGELTAVDPVTLEQYYLE